jgi:DNA methylase
VVHRNEGHCDVIGHRGPPTRGAHPPLRRMRTYREQESRPFNPVSRYEPVCRASLALTALPPARYGWGPWRLPHGLASAPKGIWPSGGADFAAVDQAIYDPFLGSGTTLIAAETTGRTCLGIELDSRYVDVAVRRWLAFTSKTAILLADGQTFEDVASQRLAERLPAHPQATGGVSSALSRVPKVIGIDIQFIGAVGTTAPWEL